MRENSPSKLPEKFVRMWHLKNGNWCHAWDVEDSAFRVWKACKSPLPSSAVYLPDGRHPPIQSQVMCGTCKDTRIHPSTMRQEFMRKES